MVTITLYHGTDARIARMTPEQRKEYTESCKLVIYQLWKIYGPRVRWISCDDYLHRFFGQDDKTYYALSYVLQHVHGMLSGNENYQYNNFYLTNLLDRAKDYAYNSFAFGELGRNAYYMIIGAEILKETKITIKDWERYPNNMKPIQRGPVVIGQTRVPSPEDIFTYVEGFKNWQPSLEVKPYKPEPIPDKIWKARYDRIKGQVKQLREELKAIDEDF